MKKILESRIDICENLRGRAELEQIGDKFVLNYLKNTLSAHEELELASPDKFFSYLTKEIIRFGLKLDTSDIGHIIKNSAVIGCLSYVVHNKDYFIKHFPD